VSKFVELGDPGYAPPFLETLTLILFRSFSFHISGFCVYVLFT